MNGGIGKTSTGTTHQCMYTHRVLCQLDLCAESLQAVELLASQSGRGWWTQVVCFVH